MLKEGERGFININDNDDFPDGLSLVLPDNFHPLTLKSGSGANEKNCGTVSNFSQYKFTTGGDDLGFYVGGEFEITPNLSLPTSATTNCTGAITVTLVHN